MVYKRPSHKNSSTVKHSMKSTSSGDAIVHCRKYCGTFRQSGS